MKSRLDRPTRETMAALVKKGLTRQQIAERLGISYFFASHVLRVYGLKPEHAPDGQLGWLVTDRERVVMHCLDEEEARKTLKVLNSSRLPAELQFTSDPRRSQVSEPGPKAA